MKAPLFDRRALPAWLAVDAWAAPDGWRHRRFKATPPEEQGVAGSLLFQTGRADFLEKYLESFHHWRSRGWAIEGFDWRGQGGSGRILADVSIGHCAPYASLSEDLAAYVREWRGRTPGPHVAIGHSMGGHVLLRCLAGQAIDIDAAILSSPMLGIVTPLLSARVARALSRLACRLGYAERPIWRQTPATFGRRQRNLTHDPARFADEQWWRERDGMLDVGAPSWGWLAESCASIDALAQPGRLEAIRLPLLILYAERDALVSAEATRSLAARLPHAELHAHPSAAHELLRETDDVRAWALDRIDRFLDRIGASS